MSDWMILSLLLFSSAIFKKKKIKTTIVPRPLQTRRNWVWKPEEVQCSLQSPECFQCGWERTGAYQAPGSWRWVGKASTKTWSILVSHTEGLTLSTKALSCCILSETDWWVLRVWRITGINYSLDNTTSHVSYTDITKSRSKDGNILAPVKLLNQAILRAKLCCLCRVKFMFLV